MVGPSNLSVRPPAVAGRFYPGNSDECARLAKSFLKPHPEASSQPWLGAIVPHAGWICSGAVAGQAIATLAAQGPVDLVVIFGAVHTPIPVQHAALDPHNTWDLPAQPAKIAKNLYHALESQDNLFAVDGRLHDREHSIEVNIPLVQQAFPGAPVLPIEIPAVASAPLMGRKTAQCLAETGLRVMYLASTDFTHYGPNYGFAPAGVGTPGIQWAIQNDRRLLKLISELDAENIVPEVQQHHNACGAGAIAALLAAGRQLGATSAKLLWHTNSYETLANVCPQPPTNAVGYAAIAIG